MLKDYNLGQYYSASSVIHALDPRTKLIGLVLFSTGLFFLQRIHAYFFAIILSLTLIWLSRIPLAYVLRLLRPFWVFILGIGMVHVLFTPGHALVQLWGPIAITKEGINLALVTSFRVIILMAVASLVTLTTTPLDLGDGLEKLLKPLGKLGIPTHEIAMMVVIGIRFFPTLLNEAQKIMKAQMARGADFHGGGLFQRTKMLLPWFIPLLVSAFRKAEDLAVAMEARCYKGGQGRTSMREMVMVANDYRALGLMTLWVVFAVLLRFWW